MLDPADYKEPRCLLCDGDFYFPDKDAPKGRIPIDRILRKLDDCFDHNEMDEAGRLLRHWLNEAEYLKDKDGELFVLSEMMGYYRKTREEENALESVRRGLDLVKTLGTGETVSGATVILNAATTLKAFGKAEKSLPLYEKVLNAYKKLLGENDERMAGLYNNYALALVDLKNYTEAEKLYLSAIKILKDKKNGENDTAVTYVNMAHMYEQIAPDDESRIENCLDKAYACLNSDKLERDGYHAYVCAKCAPSFGYFGYFLIDAELKERAEILYART